MAGIGFRLRQFVDAGTYIGEMKGYAFAILICAGPWLITVATLGLISALGARLQAELTLFRVSLIYTYAFSLIISGVFQFSITRYMADKIFARDRSAQLPTLMGALSLLVLIQLPVAVLFYAKIQATPSFRLAGVTLFMTIGAIWLTLVFLGVVRAYMRIIHCFAVGSAVSLIGTLGAGVLYRTPEALLWSFTAGQFVILVALLGTLLAEFEVGSGPDYGFLEYYRRFPFLAPCGVLFYLGSWADEMLYWFAGPGGQAAPDWFYVYNPYDVAGFLAQLTTLPAIALFFVRAETSFYESYRAFYDGVVQKLNLAGLQERRVAIYRAIREGLRELLVWQGFATFAAAAFPETVFRFAGLSHDALAFARVQTISALFVSLFLMTMIVMMYFEFYREAFISCVVLLVTNIAATSWTLAAGPQTYGLGGLASSVAGWVVGAMLLSRGLRDLEFLTFTKQPVSSQLAYDPALRASPQGFGRYVIRGGQTLGAILAVGLAVLLAAPAEARAAATTPILVLFKGSEGATARDNEFRLFAHAHAQALGFEPTYRDIDRGLPDEEEMLPYHAVVTWYRGPVMKEATVYIPWLIRQLFGQRKVVVLGNFGAYSPDGKTWLSHEALNRFFLPFGLEFQGNWIDKGERLAVVSKDSPMVEAELPLDLTKINHYFHFRSIHPKNRAYLTVRRTDLPHSASALVVRTPLGALTLARYIYAQTPRGYRMRLDLRRFLEEVLPGEVAIGDLPTQRALGLLKRGESPVSAESRLNRYVFRPLFELGYWLDFHYVEDGFPSQEAMRPYQAVVTWFETGDMENGIAYPGWLARQIADGRKVVILGNYGAFKSRRRTPTVWIDWWTAWRDINSFFYPFGLEFAGDWTGDPRVLKIVEKVPGIVEAEIPLHREDLRHYLRWKSIHPENKSYLVVDRRDRRGGKSSFVVRTPYGCMALEGYVFHWDARAKTLKFRLNIPAFLQECLTYRAKSSFVPPALVTHDELVARIRRRAPPASLPPQLPVVTLPSATEPEFKRRVLALFKRSEGSPVEPGEPEVDFIVQASMAPLRLYAEIILNHLGLVVDHWDVDKGLPPDEEMDKYRGVLTWFSTPDMSDALGYAEWVKTQIARGRRFVILGDVGTTLDRGSDVQVRAPEAILEALGFRYRRLRGGPVKPLRVVREVAEVVEFERPLDLAEIAPFDYTVQATAADARVYLTVVQPGNATSDVVAVTPRGGIALHEFAFYSPGLDPKREAQLRARLGLGPSRVWLTEAHEGGVGSGGTIKGGAREAQSTAMHGAPGEMEPSRFWRIDPFRFFAAALGVERSPRPDVTTLNGQRIFYSHIDGDGLVGISMIDRSSFAGELIRDSLLKRFNLPISASVITRDIEVDGTPTYNKPLQLARSIFALENVEPATHTYSHPFDWRIGTLDVRWENGKWVMGRRILPDLDKEILASIAFINRNLVPPGKRTEIVFWSGATNPGPEALRATREAGVKNLNGGDPIFDDEHPSLSHLAPLSLRQKDSWQIQTSASAELIYTDGWTRNFGGQQKVIEHFDRTGTPRRLYPVNIYYHFYSGDRQEGIDALAAAYRYALAHRVAPLFASEYVSVVEDFLATRIVRRSDGGWEVYNGGAMRTIRFDRTTRVLDLERSRGVLGYTRVNEALYVHLDEGRAHEIHLTADPSRRPYLRAATHYVQDWRSAAKRVGFVARGLGPARFVIAGLNAMADYRVRVARRGGGSAENLLKDTIRSDADGELVIETEFREYHGQYRIEIEAAAR